jgi:hypothetical protein
MEDKMLKSFAKMTFAAVAAGCLLYQPANAGDWTVKVTPNSNTFGGPVIEVESDGEKWTGIRRASHQLDLDVEVDVSSGWRIQMVYVAVPTADFCASPEPEECRVVANESTKRVKRDLLHDFHTDNIGGIDQLSIVGACNAGDHPATQERTLFSDINVGIKAFILSRREANDPQEPNSGRTETGYARAPITIRCLAGPSKAEAPPKPASVDIRVAQTGNTCPKDAEVTAYIDYEKPMTGRFQVVHNGKPGETIEIKAREVSFAGKTWYRIERLESYALDPGKHDFQIKVIGGGESPARSLDIDCPPFKVTSAWLKYAVEDKDTCPKKVVEEATFNANGPGDAPYRIKTQGGLVVTQGTAKIARDGDKYIARATRALTMGAFDQMMQLELIDNPSAGDQKPLEVACVEALSGELTLRSAGAKSCKGEALVAIHSNGAGELPYELECGPGKSWQRKVAATANKIGVDKVAFDVTNNEQVTCALRTRIGGTLKRLDGASMTFTCHKPIDTGADDYAPETRTDPQKPGKPGKIVIDPPRDAGGSKPEPAIACAGGTVKGGACVCERTMKPVKADRNAFRCVKVAVDPKPDKPTVSQPKIACAGGAVRNGACVCGRGEKPVKAGKDAWRCVKVVVIDPPRNRDGVNRSDAKLKGNSASAKFGKAKAGSSSRSSSAMPR